MPRILLFAATTGYQTKSFVEAARRRGVDVLLATDRCHIMEDPWGDRALAVRFEDPEESAAFVVSEILYRRVSIDGIVAVADRPTQLASLTASRLALPWHPPHAAAASRDKHQMRVLFAGAGLPVPRFRLLPEGTDPHVAARSQEFPCVLKPLGLSGSRGVIRANHQAEFIQAFRRICRILEQAGLPRALQAEQYIPGREFALEGLMNHGALHTLAIFDKPDPLEGPFFEETIYVTPSREPAETQFAIEDTVRQAARALGLWHGPIHAEMRVNTDGVFMLEIAARPIGGLCARVLRLRSPQYPDPLSLEEVLILQAIGALPPDLSPDAAGDTSAAGVMMIPVPRAGVLHAVHGSEDAEAVPWIEDVVLTAKPGEMLVPLPEGASYTGFLFARAPDPASAEQSLRQAHRALRFDILSALDVLG